MSVYFTVAECFVYAFVMCAVMLVISLPSVVTLQQSLLLTLHVLKISRISNIKQLLNHFGIY